MHMFIPNRLEIAEHPEIDVLPLNILFAKSKVQDARLSPALRSMPRTCLHCKSMRSE